MRRPLALSAVLAVGAGLWPAAAPAQEPPPPAEPPPAGEPAPPPEPVLPTRRPAPVDAVTIAATGDIVMGDTGNLPADGGRGFFRAVTDVLRAPDLTLGNLEGTLSRGGADPCPPGSGCFSFQTPPGYARWLRLAGFDVMTLANNHFGDYGASGARQTVAALDGEALAYTGRPGDVAVLDADGVAVAFLGFAPHPWASPFLDLRAVRAQVREAARYADVVVVAFHAGGEGDAFRSVFSDGVPTVAFARAAVDAGADLVVGHGPHVLRGLEWYRGRAIAYSLGNFGGWSVFNLSGYRGLSAVLEVTLARDGSWVDGRLVPTRLAGPGVPVPDLLRRGVAAVRDLSRADFGVRGMRVAPSGRLVPPRALSAAGADARG